MKSDYRQDADRLIQRAEADLVARAARLGAAADVRVGRVVGDRVASSGSSGSSGSGGEGEEEADVYVYDVIPLDVAFESDLGPGPQTLRSRDRLVEPIAAAAPFEQIYGDGDMVLIHRLGNGLWWIVDGASTLRVRFCKPDADIPAGSSGTVSIWIGPADPASADTGEDVESYSIGGVVQGQWCTTTRIAGFEYVSPMECP